MAKDGLRDLHVCVAVLEKEEGVAKQWSVTETFCFFAT
jgi:hypothetical protein